MRRHETPTSVAAVLARHAPRHMKRILDPAVGNGVLLEPFLRRIRRYEIFAVDTDSRPLRRIDRELASHSRSDFNIIHADFLKWVCDYRSRGGPFFDCIVMNPPFAARKHKWRSLVNLAGIEGSDFLPKIGPIEAGFVLGAVALLKPRGRLLAILPASLVTSPCFGWIRQYMTVNGAIRHVHELPRFTFPKIEGRIYLVVFEKGVHQDKTLLLNHDLFEPEEISVAAGTPNSQRLDFGYHNSIRKINALKGRRSLGWQPLGELARIWRGTEATPGISSAVIHTGNFHDGFWRSSKVRSSGKFDISQRAIRPGDILVKRVSRNCARTFGLSDGIRYALGSDCVVIVRPRVKVGRICLLFALRCLMALDFGPALLEKGTGASYLAQKDLGGLEIPFALSRQYSKCFCLYVKAVQRRCFASMQAIEAEVGQRLLGSCMEDKLVKSSLFARGAQ